MILPKLYDFGILRTVFFRVYNEQMVLSLKHEFREKLFNSALTKAILILLLFTSKGNIVYNLSFNIKGY